MVDLAGEDLVEFFAVAESVLNHMSVISDPNVYAIMICQILVDWIVFQIRAGKVRPETRVSTTPRVIFKT